MNITKHSMRFVRLGLVWISIIFLGALACDFPAVVGSGTPSPVPATATIAPAATEPPSPSSTSTPPALASPPAPAPTGAQDTPSAPETSEVSIYLIATGDNGASGKLVGCGDSLVPVTRTIAPTRQPITAALNELFALKEQSFGESGLYNALYQSNLRVESAEVDENRIATVVLTGQVQLGGECDTPRFKGQIEETILSSGGVQSANILLNGKTIDEALSLR